MSSHTTVAEPSRFALDPIKNSRFVASVAPVHTEDEALAHVASVSEELKDARHHCWAYRLADGRTRSSDAGEPGGSAGRPILAQIEGHDLVDVCVVVTRWFGGTKLGVGGLIRAYGGCAGKALDRAVLREVIETRALKITHDYDQTAAIDAVLGSHGLARREADYSQVVTFWLDVPLDLEEAVRTELIDRTSGRVEIE